MIFHQSGVAPPVPVPDLDNFINVNTNVLDKFIQKNIDQAFIGDPPFQSIIGAENFKSTREWMFVDQPSKSANTSVIS